MNIHLYIYTYILRHTHILIKSCGFEVVISLFRNFSEGNLTVYKVRYIKKVFKNKEETGNKNSFSANKFFIINSFLATYKPIA